MALEIGITSYYYTSECSQFQANISFHPPFHLLHHTQYQLHLNLLHVWSEVLPNAVLIAQNIHGLRLVSPRKGNSKCKLTCWMIWWLIDGTAVLLLGINNPHVNKNDYRTCPMPWTVENAGLHCLSFYRNKAKILLPCCQIGSKSNSGTPTCLVGPPTCLVGPPTGPILHLPRELK